jgi:UDP:flavonoid glycosyltransferase YjiC (YdhE family)
MARIAYFVSPHGFGHATRSAAVMAAIQALSPTPHFDIFTQAPEWLFNASLSGLFSYHPLMSDIGLVQKSPLEEDLEATLQRLDGFLPFNEHLLRSLTEQVRELECQVIVCDIAPLGIIVAKQAGIPSVLIENFTWDWIYAGYLGDDGRFAKYIAYLGEVFQSASYHIQTEPVCHYTSADLITPPVSRSPRLTRSQTRQRLGIPQDARMVLVTMGGVEFPLTFADHPATPDNLYFVVPGGNPQASARRRILLPYHSDFYHPDLVHACDAIVGKAGYSTLAEAYLAGVPYIYTARRRFRETASIAAFIEKELGGFEIQEEAFLQGEWVPGLADLLMSPRRAEERTNGAVQAARFIVNLLS